MPPLPREQHLGLNPSCLGLCREERLRRAPRPTEPLLQHSAMDWHGGQTDPVCVSPGALQPGRRHVLGSSSGYF